MGTDVLTNNRVGRKHGGPRPSGHATRSTKAVLLSLQQASVEYGPPYTSLRDLVVAGHLPAVKFGNQKRIWVKREDLERLIARSTERS